MSDEPVKRCPKCGKSVRRLIGGGLGVIFKGSGFYVTDNKRSGNGSADRHAPKQGANGKSGEEKKQGAAKSEGSDKTSKDSGPAVKESV